MANTDAPSSHFAFMVTMFCFTLMFVDIVLRSIINRKLLERTGIFQCIAAYMSATTTIWTLGPPKYLLFHQLATCCSLAALVISVICVVLDMRKANAWLYYKKRTVDGKRVRFFQIKHFYDISVPLAALILALLNKYNVEHKNSIPPNWIEVMKAVVIVLGGDKIITAFINERRICARRREDNSLVEMRTVPQLPSTEYFHILEDLPNRWDDALSMVNCGSEQQCDEAIKFIKHELSLVIRNENCRVDEIVKDGDVVILYLTSKVKSYCYLEAAKTLECYICLPFSNPGQDILSVLQQAFEIKRLARSVRQTTLEQLITTILMLLVDEKIPPVNELKLLRNAFRTLMIAILNGAEQTYLFVILVDNLCPLDSFGMPVKRNKQLEELVVNYLNHITKALHRTINELDVLCIVHSIQIYFEQLGKEGVRQRVLDQDLSLCMIMRTLYELISRRHDVIKEYIGMPINMDSPPIIFEYIDHYLQVIC